MCRCREVVTGIGPVAVRFSFGFLFISLFVCCIGLLSTGPAAARPITAASESGSQIAGDNLSRVRTLIKANVLELARSILEQDGPPVLPTQAWLNWERQLWKVYRITGRWQQLLTRVGQIPLTFPDEIHAEADVQAIHAFIELGQGVQARVLLRRHLKSTHIGDLESRRLRKLLIESYLVDDYLDDAHIAMRNYQSDFRSREQDWLLLSAGIFMRLGDLDSAVNILAPLDQPAARLLRIYARLQNHTLSPAQAVEKIDGLRSDIDSSLGRSSVPLRQILAVRAYAGLRSETPQSALDDLEQYLVAAEPLPTGVGYDYPHYQVSDLLDTYHKVALDEINRAGLLLGESVNLIIHGLQLPQEALPMRKAIFGYLLQGNNGPLRTRQLNDLFVTALMQSDRLQVVAHLYGDGRPFGNLKLNADVGMVLSNQALENGDIDIAAQINDSISGVPQGIERSQWLLHIARISIIAGHYDRGAQELEEWIHSHNSLTAEQADQVLQPVFDLQAVDQHGTALELLHAINNRVVNPGHLREIAYWMAESYQATQQFTHAADYYLFSAIQGRNSWDQWGLAARYRAAESLQSANLVADARMLFEDLLARAASDKRRIQIKQKLQQLWLLESNPDAVEVAQ